MAAESWGERFREGVGRAVPCQLARKQPPFTHDGQDRESWGQEQQVLAQGMGARVSPNPCGGHRWSKARFLLDTAELAAPRGMLSRGEQVFPAASWTWPLSRARGACNGGYPGTRHVRGGLRWDRSTQGLFPGFPPPPHTNHSSAPGTVKLPPIRGSASLLLCLSLSSPSTCWGTLVPMGSEVGSKREEG